MRTRCLSYRDFCKAVLQFCNGRVVSQDFNSWTQPLFSVSSFCFQDGASIQAAGCKGTCFILLILGDAPLSGKAGSNPPGKRAPRALCGLCCCRQDPIFIVLFYGLLCTFDSMCSFILCWKMKQKDAYLVFEKCFSVLFIGWKALKRTSIYKTVVSLCVYGL